MKTGTMTNIKVGRTSGFSMVELLIAVIIIGILATIIIPVLSNRASDARISAAKADMEAIANAQSQAALDTGYIVRLHVLDDSGAVSDLRGQDDIDDVVDTIRDQGLNNSAGQPTRIFLDAKTGVPLTTTIQYDRVVANPEQFGWRGPYVNYHRKLKPTTVPPVVPWTFGSPLDPWGNPYFLFVGGERFNVSDTGGWLNENTGLIQAQFTYGGLNADATGFDRLTLISLGPDGVPGSVGNPILGTGDDLVRAF